MHTFDCHLKVYRYVKWDFGICTIVNLGDFMKLLIGTLISSVSLMLLSGCNTTTNANTPDIQNMNPPRVTTYSGEIAEKVNRL